jgi:hypothetical protein
METREGFKHAWAIPGKLHRKYLFVLLQHKTIIPGEKVFLGYMETEEYDGVDFQI